jgi:hypothetical protein
MSAEFSFFTSIGLSFIAWSMLTSRYVWPRLRLMPRPEALQPLLLLHAFRFVGLAFLVPGVVSPDLPAAFARAAAYGDIVAATLALLSLLTLSRGFGIPFAWIFNVWGTADLLTAFYQANRSGLLAGQLGATYFIPTVLVPLLLTTHAVVFRLLLQRSSMAAALERPLAA